MNKNIQRDMKIPSIVISVILNTIEKTFPTSQLGAPRKVSNSDVLNYCFLVLRSGMPWRCLQYYTCSSGITWYTVYHRFIKWSKCNIFKKAYDAILNVYSKCRATRDPIHYMFSDTTFIKNLFGEDCVGPCPTDRGRKASKLSIVSDDKGVVHSLTFHPGNKNDCRILGHTLSKRPRDYWKGKYLCADKGYDTQQCRAWLQQYEMKDAILQKKQNLLLNKKRYIVENVFAWIDKSRRLLVRYDKRISTYQSFTYLALLSILGRRTEELVSAYN